MLPNQIAPPVQAPMLSLQEDINNHGISDYSMTSEEEEMQNNDTITNIPGKKLKIKEKDARVIMQ
jgi:hypothetical protein